MNNIDENTLKSIFDAPCTVSKIVKDFNFLDGSLRMYETACELKGVDEFRNWLETNYFGVIATKYPLNLLVTGLPGTGKTATSRLMVKDYKKATVHDIDKYVFFVPVDVYSDTTIDHIANQILEVIISSGGYNEQELNLKRGKYEYFKPFQSLMNAMHHEYIRICVVLDSYSEDEESIKQLTKFIYYLGLLRNYGLSIMLISTENTKVLPQFDSVFETSPYSKEQLHEILKDGAKYVFYDGAIDNDTLMYCAEYVAMINGDMRLALSILKDASFKAGYELCHKVSRHHLDCVFQERKDQQTEYLQWAYGS